MPYEKREKLTAGGYGELIRTNRNYRNLWLGQVVSLLGDWFTLVAVVALLSHYNNSATAISVLLAVRLGPSFLLVPFAGVLADRLNRRNLMLIADMMRAILVIGFLFVDSADRIWLIYVISAMQSALSAIFDPARGALVPIIASEDELVTANALGSTTWSTMTAIGSALGGLVAGLIGIDTAFLIDAASFVLSAFFVARIPSVLGQSHSHGTHTKIHFLNDLAGGLRYLKQRPPVIAFVMLKPLSAISAGAMFSFLAIQARSVFPLGEGGALSYGLLLLAVGIGSGVGPLLGSGVLQKMGETRYNLYKLLALSYLLSGIGYGLFTVMPWLLPAFLLVILGDLGGGARWVFSTTLIQNSTEDRFRGRVLSVELALMTLINVLSSLLAGWLLDTAHLPVLIAGPLFAATQIIIAAIWLYVTLSQKRNRREESLEPA